MKIIKLLMLAAMLASSAAACALPCGNGPEDGTALHGSLNTGNVYAPDTIRNNKIITNAQMIGIGAVNILDTYLSPEKYRGTELRYISHTLRERRDSRWSRLIVHQGNMSYSDNRSGNGGEIAGAYTFSYGVHYNWNFFDGSLNIKAGAQADVNVGFLYNTRNSNNPAQARLSLTLSPSAATYRFRLWQHNYSLRYELSVPLMGLMFSPNYGQSYYEIFSRGNYDHNIVPTTFGSTPSLRQILTFDFSLGRTTLRLGYMGDFQQARVNNLKYHSYSNMLLIGIVRQFNITKIVP